MTEQEEAIENLKQAVIRCKNAGVKIGITSMYQARASWAIMLETETFFDDDVYDLEDKNGHVDNLSYTGSVE